MGSNREIKSDGNINITSTQTNISGDLDVTGSINNFTFPSVDGLDGQTLVTNGANVLSFADGGTGGGSGVNYITNPRATTDTTGYATYADAAATTAVDGTGGSANITFTRNTSTPLRDGGDFKISKDAVNRQGEGIGYNFSIDNTDKSKKLIISFDYDASHAGYADDDVRLFIYDVSNSNLIRVNNEDLKAGKGKHYAQFQTASNSTSYRLIFHVASTNAAAYDVFLDEISVGPQGITDSPGLNRDVILQIEGCAGSQSFANNTVTTVTDFNSPSISTVGSMWDGTNFTAPESGYYDIHGQFTLENDPDNDYIRTLCYMLVNRQDGAGFVDAKFWRTDEKSSGTEACQPYDINSYYLTKGQQIKFQLYQQNSDGDATTINAGGAHSWLYISKRQSQSVAAGGVDIALLAGINSATSVPDSTTTLIDFGTKELDTHNAYSSGIYTVPETGLYHINSSFMFNFNNEFDISEVMFIEIRVNDVQQRVTNYREGDVSDTDNKYYSMQIHAILSVNKGDEIKVNVHQTSGATLTAYNDTKFGYLNILKRASTQTILENETIAMRATKDDTQSIPNSTTTKIEYDDVDYDTHGAFNTSTNTYTVPSSGIYDIYAKMRFADLDETVGMNTSISLFLNGSVKSQIVDESAENNQTSRSMRIYDTLSLSKGDEIHISVYQTDGSAEDTKADATDNVITIKRIK